MFAAAAMAAFALAMPLSGRASAFDSARADATVRRFMRDRSISGLSIGISEVGKSNVVRGYGPQASAGTVFAIGSLTKTFTAAAMLGLADDGRIDLDSSICRYAPEYTGWCAVTVDDLLAQRSGIADISQMPWFDRFATAPVAPEAQLGRVASLPLLFTPGTRSDYSNTNFILAASIVRRVSAEPYIVWLHRDLLDPLGLRSTHVAWPFLKDHRARGNAPLGSPTLAFGSADLESSAADLLTWARALMRGGRFERRGTRMFAESLAFDHGRIDGREAAWTSGYVGGFSAFLAVLPRERIGVVVLANADRIDLEPLATSLVRIAQGEPD